MASLKSAFLQKSRQMSAWQPVDSVSNRDRLELYSLHKQAANSDCDIPMPTSTSSTGGDIGKDKAKWNAWKSKAGVSRGEAMQRYIDECDRQVRIYGSKGTSGVVPPSGQSSVASASPNRNGGSSALTGGDQDVDDDSKIRTNTSTAQLGITAIPLLAAQASEPLASYLHRMAVTTSTTQTFWGMQRPVCTPASTLNNPQGEEPSTNFLHPTNIVSMMENVIIAAGRMIESLSLNRIIPFVPPSTAHAMLYPLNVALLTLYCAFIFLIATASNYGVLMKTILFGSKSNRGGTVLTEIVDYSITPTSRLSSSLSSGQYAIPIRILSLLLIPLPILSDLLLAAKKTFGDLPSSVLWLIAMTMTGFYWIVVLPWFAVFPNLFFGFWGGVCTGGEFWNVYGWSMLLSPCRVLVLTERRESVMTNAVKQCPTSIDRFVTPNDGLS
jgi:acyl-CoA-binding protein